MVLQKPNGHPDSLQPSFTVQIEDSTGAVIDSTCGYYYIYAHLDPVTQQPPPTWHKHGPSGSLIIWKEWTTVGMSLMSYLGHQTALKVLSKSNRICAFDREEFPAHPLYNGSTWFLPYVGSYFRARDWMDRKFK